MAQKQPIQQQHQYVVVQQQPANVVVVKPAPVSLCLTFISPVGINCISQTGTAAKWRITCKH